MEYELYPGEVDEEPQGWSSDSDAREMNELRGMIMVQSSETEAVLGMILRKIKPGGKIDRPAGSIFNDITKNMGAGDIQLWKFEISCIGNAIELRNRAVHDRVRVASVWRDYATEDGGEWVPVLSFLGADLQDEVDLIGNLKVQQLATISAVRILRGLDKI
ncbi:hypothetical protein [Actinoalloteichus hymeniacidonis]|uniref:hypothetical protein n=1 Tax=Actinoalloteichus hymeniacidonis TaxID=340345 RepID=UPI0012F7FCBE|nr:hypothetical protein [Actinoalloteichus hymeniacidonis]MBB5908266.1 hypothetical protein [Actinoalloteichus hymeniacidonis]